jgi:hypothetical protein
MGVGISIGALAAIVLALGSIWFRRRVQREQEAPKTYNEVDSRQILENYPSQQLKLPARSAPLELDSKEISELDRSR